MQISGFESDVGASGRRRLYRCVCVVLLEGGEGLEEFGQVDLRVAAGGQGFVWHLLQPLIHVSFFGPVLEKFWRVKEGKEKEASSSPELNGGQFLNCIKVDTMGY